MADPPNHSTGLGRVPPIGGPRSMITNSAPQLVLHDESDPGRSNAGSTEAERKPSTDAPAAGADFISFYRAEHDGQVRRAFLLLGSEAAAHDVVADAFVTMYRKWGDVDSPGPYLNRCVLNGCRDFHRITKREVPTDPADGEPRGRSTASRNAVDPVDHLADLLVALPFRQRAAIVLRFYGSQSEAEIADYLDCRSGTVGSLIHRALKTLKKELS